MLITKWLTGWKSAARRKNRRIRSSHPAIIEHMEDRVLLTTLVAGYTAQHTEAIAGYVATNSYERVSFDESSGEIAIAGSLSADEVYVDYDSSSGIRKVQVTLNGSVELEVAAVAVSSITFEGYTGSDYFENGTDIPVYASGGGGDDTIIAGQSDIVTTGDGADVIVLGQWLEDAATEIMDYDAADDSLLLVWDLKEDPDPQVAILADEADASVNHVLVNGTEIATVHGATPPDPLDIILVDSGLTGPDLQAG